MKKPFFHGTCTALVTPFLDGKINYPMLEQLLRRQMEAGVRAVVLCGTTGEAPTLSDEEKLEIFRRGKEFAGNRCLILAGTGSNCTAHSVYLSAAAQEAGVDGLLVVSPYYNKATADGLIAHYGAIADAVDIPIILYNVPSRTGVDIPVSVYKQLSGIPNIVGTKEASGDISKISRILTACGPGFSVWSGNDDQTVAAMAMGAAGVISVTSNLLPVLVQAMSMAVLDGDLDTAAALQLKMTELNTLLFAEVNPIPVKAAMKCMGYNCGNCRLPLTQLSEVNQKKLEALLADCNFVSCML